MNSKSKKASKLLKFNKTVNKLRQLFNAKVEKPFDESLN